MTTEERLEAIRVRAEGIGLNDVFFSSAVQNLMRAKGIYEKQGDYNTVYCILAGRLLSALEPRVPGVRLLIAPYSEMGVCKDCMLNKYLCPFRVFVEGGLGKECHIPGPGCPGPAPAGHHYELVLVKDEGVQG